MAAPTSASYRHFLYVTSGRAVLPASAALTPSVDYRARRVVNNAPIPVGVSRQRESSMFSMAGAIDGGDLALALANWLPHRYSVRGSGINERTGFIFLLQDGDAPAGFTAPQQYDRVLSWSQEQPVLEARQPTLESLRMEFRRQGDMMLTSSWFAQNQREVDPRPADPAPSPAPRPRFVEGANWAVRASRDGSSFTEVDGVLRATVAFPRFREPVYRGGDGESWGEITDSFASEPVITLALLSDQDYIDGYFRQGDRPYFIEIDGGDYLRMRFQTEFMNKRPWGSEGNALMVDAAFCLVGQYSGAAPVWPAQGTPLPTDPVRWPQELYGYFEVYDPIHTGFG
ncbi:MAG: hypothetical protein F4Y84_06700 [Caldilineaceae bacterium SB0665_bin_25]|nr:hypothetical protein [Caldilineaceae bacterium SB0665_bin_25]